MSQSKIANRRIVLNSRPVGAPTANDFRLETGDVPTPGAGQVLLRTVWLSLDPYMRGRMSDAPSYAPPVQLGDVMVGGTISRVVASNLPAFREGDLVVAAGGWQVAGLCAVRRQRPDSARPRFRASVARARRARHAGIHGVYGAAHDRRAEGR